MESEINNDIFYKLKLLIELKNYVMAVLEQFINLRIQLNLL